MILENPVTDVNDVNVLFDDDVAGKNAVIHPVAKAALGGRCVGPRWPLDVTCQNNVLPRRRYYRAPPP